MLKIGKTDGFERRYMQHFREFAGQFGEFVTYERDRGARDIGLHLTRWMLSGDERLTSALCWFQMKGIMKSTLSAAQFQRKGEAAVQLEVNHLRYWFLQPTPTYLVVYVEAVDKFLVCNIQDYVATTWGKDILTLDQQTALVTVSKDSELDDQAFRLILRKSDIEAWQMALEAPEGDVRLCNRDYKVIWHFGTAAERGVEHHIEFWDWQSKTRGQAYLRERTLPSGDWWILREHWQYRMSVEDLEDSYRYLHLYDPDEDPDAEPAPKPKVIVVQEPTYDEASGNYEYDYHPDDDGFSSDVPCVVLRSGSYVYGEDVMGEYHQYVFSARLNELGKELFEHVKVLVQCGFIEIDPDSSEMISVAPWGHRDV